MCFIKGVKIDHFTHVPGSVSQYSAESEYNLAFIAGIAISHFRMLNNEIINKYPDVILEQLPLIILDRKSAICMANNGKDTRHIAIIIHFVRNC